jgi:hypothetical protein
MLNLFETELNTLFGIFCSMSELVLILDFGTLPINDKSVVASARSELVTYYPGAGPSLGATQKVDLSVVDPKAPSLTP